MDSRLKIFFFCIPITRVHNFLTNFIPSPKIQQEIMKELNSLHPLVTCKGTSFHYQKLWVLQLSFVTKIQLHVSVACDTCNCKFVQLHKTSCTQHLVTCDITYATCIYGVNIHVHRYILIQMQLRLMCNSPCNYNATNKNMTHVLKLDNQLVETCH